MTKDQAIARLRELCPPGTTVYTILRHCSRSGMHRRISCVVKWPDGMHELDWAMVKSGRFKRRGNADGIAVGGCGMDMGFHLVYELSQMLYPNGFGCIGDHCHSNDHSNGDRDYTPHYDGTPRLDDDVGKDLKPHQHWHKSGGYALRHRWL